MKNNRMVVGAVLHWVAWIAAISCASSPEAGPGRRSRDSGADGSEVGSTKHGPTDGGGCIPVVARRYDAARDCYQRKVMPGVCLVESEPETTSGVAEIACLVGPDGTRYAIVKGYTQCLDDVATSAHWSAVGEAGLCERSTLGVLPDGGAASDPACAAVIARGYWALGPFGPRDLDFATDSDAGGPRGDRVGECP